MLSNNANAHRHARIFLLLLAAFVLWLWLPLLRGKLPLPGAEAVFVVLLAALPLFGYLLARLVTHTIEVRFVLGAVIGLSALLAIGLSSLFNHERFANLVIVLLFVTIAIFGARHIQNARKSARETLSALTVTPEIKAAVTASPSKRLYFQNPGQFALARYYEPDLEVRSRMVLIYSRDQELHWDHMDTISLTALHMRNFTDLTITPYEAVTTQPGDYIFVDAVGRMWNWTDQAFAAAHADVKPLGSAFGGDALSVRFLP